MAARVLLVLPTQSYRAQAFLDAARRAGVEVCVATDEPSTLAALTGGEVVVDLGRPDEAAERAATFAAGRHVHGVVGVDESAVLTAATIARRLGLRHHAVEAVAATRDKRRLRAALDHARLPQPRWTEIASGGGEDLAAAVERVGGYPVVVKPVDQAGSRGVLRVDGRVALRDAVDRVGRLLDRLGCTPGPLGHPLLLERFAAGGEVAVEGLVTRGRVHILAVFDKPDPLDGPAFAETIYTTPTRHPPVTRAQIAALTVAGAAAVGLSDGPLHAELRLTAGGPLLLEIAARSIGGLCSGTLRLGPGGMWSLEELIIRHAIGDSIGERETTPGGPPSGVLMLPVLSAGVLRRVEGVEAAAAVAGVTSVVVSVALGTAVEPLPEGDRYLGFVLATRPTPLEVEQALRGAWAQLRVVIEGADHEGRPPA